MDLDTFISCLTAQERSVLDTLLSDLPGLQDRRRGELARHISSVLAREGALPQSPGPLIEAIVARFAPVAVETLSLSLEEQVARLPYPLAMAVQTLLADAERRQAGAQLPQFPFQLTAVMGLLVRMTAVIAIESYVQLAKASDAAVNQRVVAALRAPADGTWLEVAVALLKHLTRRADTPLAHRAYKALRERTEIPGVSNVEQALRKLIAYRNRLLHGEAVSLDETNLAYSLLLAALKGFGFLGSYTLLASYEGRLWQLSGLLPQLLPEETAPRGAGLSDNAPFLLHHDGNEPPLSMAPLLVFRPGDSVSPVAFDELFFLNAGVAERLDYIAYRYARNVGGRALGTYDDFRRFLQRLPAPVMPRDPKIDFGDLVAYHYSLFVGRRAVLDEIASFIDEPPAPYAILTAQGGMGKTAILAQLHGQYESALASGKPCSNRWVFHFCMSVEDRGNAVVALRSIIARVCEQVGLPAVAYLSNDFEVLRDRFVQLLQHTAARLRPAERFVLAVDALDEGLGTNSSQSLLRAFPSQLPPSIVMLLSYRVGLDGSNTAVERSLSHIPCDSRRALSSASPLPGLTPEDVATFLGLAAPGIEIPKATVAAVCAAADRESAGIDPFYLRFVAEGIARGRIQMYRPESVPISLDEAFDKLWLELPAARDYLVHRLLCTLAIMQDYGDDLLFADLFSRSLPAGVEPLTPLEVASLRAQAGKLLVFHGDRYGLMHERLRRYLVGTTSGPGSQSPNPAYIQP